MQFKVNLVDTSFHYLSVNYLIDFFPWPEWAAFGDLKAEKWIVSFFLFYIELKAVWRVITASHSHHQARVVLW